MKKIITLLLVLCMLFGLVGCSTVEKEFLNTVYGKVCESYTSTGTMEIKLTSAVPKEIKDDMKPFNLQSLLNALSDFKLAWGESAYVKDNDINTKTTFGISTPSASFVTNSYIYTENGDMVTVVDLPSIAKAFLPEEYENASKAYFKFSEFNEFSTDMINMNYAEFFKIANSLNKDMQKFILNYGEFVPEITGLIKKIGTTYTLTISDEQLKNIINSAVTAYMTNDEARKTANEFIVKFCEIYKSMYTEEFYNETFGIFAEQLNTQKKEDLLYAYEEFNDAMEVLKKIRILGNDGIKISYTFQGGYIKNVSGLIDFVIDISNISGEIDGTEYSSDFYIGGVIKYNQDITNINKLKKTDVIDFDLSDAVSFIDWVNAYNTDQPAAPEYEYEYDYNYDYCEKDYLKAVTLPAEDGSITIMDYDYKMDLMGLEAKNINGTLYIPLEALLNSYYDTDYYWDNEAKEMVIPSHTINYYIKADTNIIYTDTHQIALNGKVLNIDGYLYVPLRSYINAVYHDTVYWSSDLNTAFIGGEFYYNWYIEGDEY